MKNNPLVSIVILNLNRKKDLIECLDTIYEQDYPNFEVILIDNGSSDGSLTNFPNRFSKVRIYKTKTNLGTSYTRNAGVKFSNGKYIWFLDNDCLITNKSALTMLINTIKKDPNIAGIGGETISDLIDNKSSRTKYLKLFKNGLTKGFFQKVDEVEVLVIPTCNLFLLKKSILDVGGFDHFYFFYLEDIDLTYRIAKHGYKLINKNMLSVVHKFSKASRFRNHFKSKRNRIYFILKNFSFKSILLLPFYDFNYLLSIDSFKRLLSKIFRNNKKVQKYSKSYSNKESNIKNLFQTLEILVTSTISIFLSYIYIPIYLIKYNFKKLRKKNFILDVNPEDFN